MKDHPMFLPALAITNAAAVVNSFMQWAETWLRFAILILSLLISLLTAWRQWQKLRHPPRTRQPRVFPTRLPAFLPALLLTALLCPGCSFLSSTSYDLDSGKRSGRVVVYTLLDGNSSLTKLRQSKAGTTIGSLQEASTSTNLNALAAQVVSAAISAAK